MGTSGLFGRRVDRWSPQTAPCKHNPRASESEPLQTSARRKFAAFLGLFLIATVSSVAAADELRMGFAEADITPPDGFPMAGYYHERLATGTRDPLKAKAIVFRSASEQAGIVVCDLTGIARDLAVEVRQRAASQTGIPADHLVIAATHSHTAPDYTKDLYRFLAGEKADPDRPFYARKLIDGAVDAIVRAHSAARPVTIQAGSARQETPISFPRRFVMKDGSVRTWMRLDHPDVVRAAGPIDPDVSLLVARDVEQGKPIGVFSNFALHLDTLGGTQWSADYPYYVERSLRGTLGESVVSVFGLGCCGDINHVDPVSKDRNKTDFIGESLAGTIQSGLPKLSALENPELQARSAVVRLPMQPVDEAMLDRAKQLLIAAKAGEKTEFFDLVLAYKSVMLDQLQNKPPRLATADHLSWGLSHQWAGIGAELPADVQVITLGREVAIVCLPGEVFVDLGLDIKRHSPYRTTFVVELANCVETVYIPTRAAYAGGSYEVTNSALAPGGGEMLVEAALRLLRDTASTK